MIRIYSERPKTQHKDRVLISYLSRKSRLILTTSREKPDKLFEP